MAQVDARKAKRSYKKQQRRNAEGRKGRDGSEAVIKLGPLRERIQDLVGLRIAAAQAMSRYNDAVKATAEATGLVSATINKFVRSRAGDNFREERMKAAQLALVFEELGELGPDEKPEGAPHPETLFDGNGEDDDVDGADVPPHVGDPEHHVDPESSLH